MTFVFVYKMYSDLQQSKIPMSLIFLSANRNIFRISLNDLKQETSVSCNIHTSAECMYGKCEHKLYILEL